MVVKPYSQWRNCSSQLSTLPADDVIVAKEFWRLKWRLAPTVSHPGSRIISSPFEGRTSGLRQPSSEHRFASHIIAYSLHSAYCLPIGRVTVNGATFNDGLDKPRFLAPRSPSVSALLLMRFTESFVTTSSHLCILRHHGCA